MKIRAPEGCKKEIKEIIEEPYCSSTYTKLLLGHSDDDLEEALALLKKMNVGKNKQAEIQKELNIRKRPEQDVGGVSEEWKEDFVRQWNQVRIAAGHIQPAAEENPFHKHIMDRFCKIE